MTGSRARRNGVAPYMASMLLVLIDDMPEAQETARLSGAAGTAAASRDVASWDGNPLAWSDRRAQKARAETAGLALCEA